MPQDDSPPLAFRPLEPALMDALGSVLRGSWGKTCWCMYPRLPAKEFEALPGSGPLGPRRRAAMTGLARAAPAPGLVAFEGEEAVGWAAVAPRTAFARVCASRATPAVDAVPVWAIPCITVRKTARGRGVAVALVRAAAAFAFECGAPAVEAYPRAGEARTGADNAFFGTEPLFRRAGFRVVRGPLEGLPRNWVPRVAMRLDAPGKEEDA